jgi:uncharacterized membrane protein YqjE
MNMASDTQTGSEPSVTSLVNGILDDVRELVKQQAALFKAEVQEDLQKTKEATLALAWGIGVGVLGILLLALALPLFLNWAVPALPLWAWFGIVGAVLAVIGGVLLYTGKKRFESFTPLPVQSVEALRENLTWTTSRR